MADGFGAVAAEPAGLESGDLRTVVVLIFAVAHVQNLRGRQLQRLGGGLENLRRGLRMPHLGGN